MRWRIWCGSAPPLGEDPGREGLQRTPARVEKALQFLTSGYTADIDKIVNDALYTVTYDEMVIVQRYRDFQLLRASPAAVLRQDARRLSAERESDRTDRRSRASSMLSRAGCRFRSGSPNSRRRSIQDAIDPVGVGVVCEARHLCMMMRGVEKQHSGAITSAMLGGFRTCKETRDEFLALVSHRMNGGLAQPRGDRLQMWGRPSACAPVSTGAALTFNNRFGGQRD